MSNPIEKSVQGLSLTPQGVQASLPLLSQHLHSHSQTFVVVVSNFLLCFSIYERSFLGCLCNFFFIPVLLQQFLVILIACFMISSVAG